MGRLSQQYRVKECRVEIPRMTQKDILTYIDCSRKKTAIEKKYAKKDMVPVTPATQPSNRSRGGRPPKPKYIKTAKRKCGKGKPDNIAELLCAIYDQQRLQIELPELTTRVAEVFPGKEEFVKKYCESMKKATQQEPIPVPPEPVVGNPVDDQEFAVSNLNPTIGCLADENGSTKWMDELLELEFIQEVFKEVESDTFLPNISKIYVPDDKIQNKSG